MFNHNILLYKPISIDYNDFIELNKEKYKNDREYIKMINVFNLMELLKIDSFKDKTFFETECKLKLRGYDEYKNIKVVYNQSLDSDPIFSNLKNFNAELDIISKERDNTYMTEELLYEYNMMKMSTCINDKANTITIKIKNFINSNKENFNNDFEFLIKEFENNLLKNLTDLHKYEDLQLLINSEYHSLKDISVYNEKIFRPATDKEFKNYLVKKGFR
ncbi:hypothetical protein [Staphylococcus phage S6]|nr:hypothetical protein [Staphylococcus phage S6]